MLKKIYPIIKKEVRQIFRDKRTLSVVLLFPVFMLIMFGYALNFDVKHISLGIYDLDKSLESRKYIENFMNSEYFDFKYYIKNKNEIDNLLDKNKTVFIIIIPKNFSTNLKRGENAKIQILIDGSNSNTASILIGYVNTINMNYSKKLIIEKIQSKTNIEFKEPINYRPRIRFNPELKSTKFLIPGLIGYILMITAVISTSLSIVREKERGTIEQIIVSPISPFQLIIGKIIPYIILSFFTAILVIFSGYLLFGITVKGSFIDLFIGLSVYLAACLGLGLLISAISNSQQMAFMISIVVTMLPTFLLSGFVFPIRNMPKIIQYITYIVPARYFMNIVRCIIVKGVGISAFWHDIVILLFIAVVLIFISSKKINDNLII